MRCNNIDQKAIEELICTAYYKAINIYSCECKKKKLTTGSLIKLEEVVLSLSDYILNNGIYDYAYIEPIVLKTLKLIPYIENELLGHSTLKCERKCKVIVACSVKNIS